MHLITGHGGSSHITSANDGALNSKVFGTGKYIFAGASGHQFGLAITGSTTLEIDPGQGIMEGRYFEQENKATINVYAGTAGMLRNDLLVIRYSKDPDTSVETASLVVIQGTDSASNPQDPAYNTSSILDGNAIADFPLYRIRLNGYNVESFTQLFTVKANTTDQISSLQSQVATNTANITAVTNQANTNKANITTVTAQANTNKTDIAALKTATNITAVTPTASNGTTVEYNGSYKAGRMVFLNCRIRVPAGTGIGTLIATNVPAAACTSGKIYSNEGKVAITNSGSIVLQSSVPSSAAAEISINVAYIQKV